MAATKSSKTSTKAASTERTDLPITHPEKILDGESGMTKRDLANYLIALDRTYPAIDAPEAKR